MFATFLKNPTLEELNYSRPNYRWMNFIKKNELIYERNRLSLYTILCIYNFFLICCENCEKWCWAKLQKIKK